MIFALSTDDRRLEVFDTEDAAVAYCEGVDVEDRAWLFWNDVGEPLDAQFTKPNKRGPIWVQSGTYRLIPSTSSERTDLLDQLQHIVAVEGRPPYDSVSGIQQHLTLVGADVNLP
jgi:hypothetical protein